MLMNSASSSASRVKVPSAPLSVKEWPSVTVTPETGVPAHLTVPRIGP
jgi:hypothetical protein